MALKTIRMILALLCLVFSTYAANPNKQAIKYLSKGELIAAETQIKKSLAKDSVNVMAHFLYAVLYNTASFARYDQDSAYHHISRSIEYFRVMEDKALAKFKKFEISVDSLTSYKFSIEKQAFLSARASADLRKLKHFIAFYANNDLRNSAVSMRDSVAFAAAVQRHTLESYTSFMQNYPHSKQLTEARNRYDELLFRSKTADNSLESMETFLKEHPDTPYRNKLEADIYFRYTINNSVNAYVRFLTRYPDSKMATHARNILYHLEKELGGLVHKHLYMTDSLLRLVKKTFEYILPVYEDGLYYFIDSDGNLFKGSYPEIHPSYLCDPIESDFIIAGKDGDLKLFTLNGELFFENFESIEDLGYGYMRFAKDGKVGVVHKSGKIILPPKYEDVKLIEHNFLLCLEKDLWGIKTFSDHTVLPPILDDVELVGQFILLYKGDKLSVTTIDLITQYYKNFAEQLSFRYDEVELIGKDYLLCFEGDQESLCNYKMDEVISSGNKRIHVAGDTWYVEKDSQFFLFNRNTNSLSTNAFDKMVSNDQWVLLKENKKWGIYYQASNMEPKFTLDSAALLGKVVWGREAKSKAIKLIYPSQVEVRIGPQDKIYPMLVSGSTDKTDYTIIAGERSRSVISPRGIMLFSTGLRKIAYLDKGLFIAEKRGLKGILNKRGNWVVAPGYHSIELGEKGLVHLLRNGKLGAYDLKTKQLFKPLYARRFVKLNDRTYVVKKGGFYGVIDERGETKIPFEYEEILPWGNFSLVLKKNDLWEIRSVESGETLKNNLVNVEFLLDNGDNQVLKYFTKGGYGLIDSYKGDLLEGKFTDIIRLGSVEKPIYFGEIYINEADLHVVVYYDRSGKKIRSQAIKPDEYPYIYCSN